MSNRSNENVDAAVFDDRQALAVTSTTDSTLEEPGDRQSAGADHGDAQFEETASICVVGLGYVGLPLSIEFDRAGHSVTGFDVDRSKIATLQDGTTTTSDLDDERVADSDVTFTTDPFEIGRAEYVVIAVPTPIDDESRPNLDYVERAGRTVGREMTAGTTVILESTVYPGATREVLVPALAKSSGLTPGEEFAVGYSPERTTPGDSEHDLRTVVKIVSGRDEAVLDDVAALYETVVDAGVHRAPSIEVAEAAKVVENIQRDLNIALVNELAMAFDRMDLDVDSRAVLEAAGSKWNFHEYHPGLVGGHCIPVDPYFFVHRSKREGFVPELVLKGRDVNESMPGHVAELAIKALNEQGKTLRESRLLLLGLSYKPDVPDFRMSKAADVIDELHEFDVEVVGVDPCGDEQALREEFGVDVHAEPRFEGFDGVVLATPHREFRSLDVEEVVDRLNDDPVVVDVWGAFDDGAVPDDAVYRSI